MCLTCRQDSSFGPSETPSVKGTDACTKMLSVDGESVAILNLRGRAVVIVDVDGFGYSVARTTDGRGDPSVRNPAWRQSFFSLGKTSRLYVPVPIIVCNSPRHIMLIGNPEHVIYPVFLQASKDPSAGCSEPPYVARSVLQLSW